MIENQNYKLIPLIEVPHLQKNCINLLNEVLFITCLNEYFFFCLRNGLKTFLRVKEVLKNV